MALITFRQGLKVNLPTLNPGEPGLTSDTKEVFLGTEDGNIQLGNMLTSTYDSDNNGVVDNSDNLGGELPSYYLDRANHTGSQSADTITDGVLNKVFTADEQTKLTNLSTSVVTASSTNGNILIDAVETVVYTHDATHPASMIVESLTQEFVSSTEKAIWNGKVDKLVGSTEGDILTVDIDGNPQDSGKAFNDDGTTDNDILSATKVISLLGGKEPTISAGFTTDYYRGDKTWHVLNKSAVGLSNVDNTSDANKPISSAVSTALSGKISTGVIGVADGLCPLDSTTKIDPIYLPSFVDDVLEFANLAAFPLTGASSTIYTALDTNKIYRWATTVYVEISASPGSSDAVPEGLINLYFTPGRAASAAPVQSVAGKTSIVTLVKADVGLSNVDNTTDLNKPVSNATGTALSGKQDTISTGTTSQFYRGDKTWQAVTKDNVGLGNVDNTSDANKPVSDATAIAIGLREPALTAGTTSQYYRGDKTWQTLDKTAVGLGNVANTSDMNKPVSSATQTALNLKADKIVGGVTGDIVTRDATGNIQDSSRFFSDVSTTNEAIWSADKIITMLGGKEATVIAGTTSQYYRGDKTWQTLDKSTIGLSNVDNTSDANKPISSATTTALSGKEATITAGATSQYYRGDKTWVTLDKTAVGLGNVDNTSDVNKPISSATATALSGKEATITAGSVSQYYRGDKTWQTLDKSTIGLSNVDNTSDVNKPISSATTTALSGKISTGAIGVANGICPLDGTTKISSTYLPAYVDDVLEFANLAAFPLTGTSGIIYVALDTNKVYRWSTTVYIEISASPGSTDAIAEGTVHLYYTDVRAAAAAPVQSVAGKTNIVTLVKADVGLSNVDNTSDANKPISSATATALSGKEATITAGTVSQYYRGDKTWQTLDKTSVGLSNVDNTSDANKPISSATSTALSGKEATITAGATSQYYRGDKTWVTLDKTAVGLSNVDNTSDANKPISSATATALSGKEATITAGTTSQYYRGDKTWQTLDKTAVGLSNVDNTSDVNKPISSATATALSDKEATVTAGSVSQYYRGDKTWQTLNSTAVGLGNVNNTSDVNKPISSATQTALNLKADKIIGGTNGDIVTRDVNGNIQDSGKIFNDAGITTNDILSASKVLSLFPTIATMSKVEVIPTVNQSLAANSWTKLVFGTEILDTLAEFNTTNSTFTVTNTGRYLIMANISFGHGKNCSKGVQIYLNGVATRHRTQVDSANDSTVDVDVVCARMMDLVAGNTITIYGWHNTNGTIDTTSAYTTLTISRIP